MHTQGQEVMLHTKGQHTTSLQRTVSSIAAFTEHNNKAPLAAGFTASRLPKRFSNSTVAMIILGPLVFTGVFLGQ